MDHRPGATEPRPILDLRELNEFLVYNHFKQENLGQVAALMEQGDWMTKVDLSKGYFHVPIAKEHQQLLCFQFNGISYCFTVLPFGLSSAPRTFQKLMNTVAKYFRRKRALRLAIYLDNWLFLHRTWRQAIRDINFVLKVFTRLKLLVNLQKSVTAPTRRLDYRGFTGDSSSMTRSLPPEKLKRLRDDALQAIRKPTTTIRRLCRVEGRIQAAEPAVLCTRARTRGLQNFKRICLRNFNRDYTAMVTLDTPSLQQL
jgi:hypothetical protein